MSVLRELRDFATVGQVRRWLGVYFGGNVVGTVSESGGVPTGAVIESGSNANGSYVRFADGTQICRRSSFTSDSADSTWTYPIGFAATPDVYVASATSGNNRVSQARVPSGGVSVDFAGFQGETGARAAHSVRLLAIGRWF